MVMITKTLYICSLKIDFVLTKIANSHEMSFYVSFYLGLHLLL